MAGFGLVLGGAAQGFQNGVKLVRDYDDVRRQQEIQQGQREAEEIIRGIPMPGQEIDPNKWTPDQAVNDALAKAKPQPDPIQRMASAAMKVLRPRDAAVAAGVAAPPAAAPAPAGGPGSDTVAPAAGLPPKDVDAVTVTPASPRSITDLERARLMVAAASRLKGPDAMGKVQEAWQNLHALEGEEFKKDVAAAQFRGPYAIANTLEKMTGGQHTFDLTPVDGQPGVFHVAVDGQDSGTPMTTAQMADAAVAYANKDPSYVLQAGMMRSRDARENRAEVFDEKYKTGSLALQKYRADIDAKIAAATAAHLSAQTDTEKAQLEQYQTEKQTLNDFTGRLHDQNGTGDALLNEQQLGELAATAPIRMKGMITSHVVLDKDGNQVVQTTNYAQDLADAAVKAAKQRYGTSPFVKQGVINVVKNPTGNGPSRLYAVKGANGGFTNFDEAEMAARRLYPKMEQAAKQPPAKK